MIDPVTELKKLFDAKKFDAAIEFCQKLLENNPNDPIALQNLSTLYYIVGAYEDALICCNKVLEKDKASLSRLGGDLQASNFLSLI